MHYYVDGRLHSRWLTVFLFTLRIVRSANVQKAQSILFEF